MPRVQFHITLLSILVTSACLSGCLRPGAYVASPGSDRQVSERGAFGVDALPGNLGGQPGGHGDLSPFPYLFLPFDVVAQLGLTQDQKDRICTIDVGFTSPHPLEEAFQDDHALKKLMAAPIFDEATVHATFVDCQQRHHALQLLVVKRDAAYSGVLTQTQRQTAADLLERMPPRAPDLTNPMLKRYRLLLELQVKALDPSAQQWQAFEQCQATYQPIDLRPNWPAMIAYLRHGDFSVLEAAIPTDKQPDDRYLTFIESLDARQRDQLLLHPRAITWRDGLPVLAPSTPPTRG